MGSSPRGVFLSLPRSWQIHIVQGMFDLRGWTEQEHVGPSVAAWVREERRVCTRPACVWGVPLLFHLWIAASLLADVTVALL